MHRAEEDYLKIIFKLTTEENRTLVKTNEITEITGYTDQTVNEMVKRLEKKKMLTFYPYKGVSLTSKGEKEAKRLVRNHRLWEVFLVEKLGYSWADVHDEAENLEHASSNLLMDQIDQFLNYPQYCVHGNAIPRKTGEMGVTPQQSLFSGDEEKRYTVKRVLDQAQFLQYLNQEKITLGTEVKIIKKDEFNHMLTIETNGKEINISQQIAEKIFVD